MPYANLPGVLVNTVDGGLVARRKPTSKSVLILGTAGQGPSDPYQVAERNQAAAIFGFDGNLTMSMEEAAIYSDNIILYRMGTSPLTLKNVGKENTAADASAITNVALTGSTITFTTTNDFIVSDSITVTGLAHSYLNGVFTVATRASGNFTAALATTVSAYVTHIELATNVAIYTSVAHRFRVGDIVTVGGLAETDLNGTITITARTTDTFSAALTHADVPGADDMGTATLDTVTSVADTGTATKAGAVVSAGFDVTFNTVTSDSATRYIIWYKAGVLAIWLDGGLVYSNDTGLGAVDTGDVALSADASTGAGMALGSGGTALDTAAITITAAAALSGTSAKPTPLKTDPVTGLGMTNRQAYIALKKALELLDIFPVDMVVCPSAVIDCPNASHNGTATNAKDVLGWLKTTDDGEGNKTYQWHDETTDSEGATVVAMTAVTPSTRLAAGFFEVNFAYALAEFCRKQNETLNGCIAFIGTQAPPSYRLVDTRNWVGYLPTYDPSSGYVKSSKDGKGLLGIAELVGCTAAKLQTMAKDKSTGRKPGFFQTTEGEYDGTRVTDIHQNPVDIGAYVHVVADHGGLTNGFLAGYDNNLAASVAGMCSSLDEKRNLTNKPLRAIQLWKPSQSQMDSLTFGKVSVLRYKGADADPALLHGMTAASAYSDYTNLMRVRIKFLVCQVLMQEADKFIGESTMDGLQLSALRTALEARVVNLQKGGYVSRADFKVDTSVAEQRIGHARIYVTFNPADELVQLTAFVGIQRR